ncbi:hypothetical protein QAD02_002901 [Eretmocerus hayati]|uniref:Uncharacterized protein n=1 Tax=Eretmocerus hayati TaxID=131215 RepID=A0ACC2NKL7_9HYME|nr:hypothetical protein QAD02_002901 [Eretmocerus hayati]
MDMKAEDGKVDTTCSDDEEMSNDKLDDDEKTEILKEAQKICDELQGTKRPQVPKEIQNSNFLKPEVTVVTPPPSEKYIRDKASITKLEEGTMRIAAEAAEVLASVSAPLNKSEDDVYLPAIKQALSEVTPAKFSECVNGVLAIIETSLQ